LDGQVAIAWIIGRGAVALGNVKSQPQAPGFSQSRYDRLPPVRRGPLKRPCCDDERNPADAK